MSWGNKILIGFLVFVAGISSMVYIAMKQTNEMVDSNYYEKELQFQSKIDAARNLNALEQKVTAVDTNGFIVIKLPSKSIGHQTKGTVQFLRPSQQSRDVEVALDVDANGEQQLNKTRFIAGTYQLKIDWMDNGVNYYYNQEINIRP